jgi:hypothetical protein
MQLRDGRAKILRGLIMPELEMVRRLCVRYYFRRAPQSACRGDGSLGTRSFTEIGPKPAQVENANSPAVVGMQRGCPFRKPFVNLRPA